MSKVSDYLILNPTRDLNVLGINVINSIGDYIKEEITLVSSTLTALNKPYTNKIKIAVQEFANTQSENDKNNILNALNDSNSGLTQLITILETQFTITQSAAELQFSNPTTPPPFLYIPNTYYIVLSAYFVLPLAIDMCTAFESFISVQYSSLGLG